MVLQKRLDYGFNGYQVPATPRATRSARRRGAIRKRVDDNSMGAFDLLATIAGKLLLEGESSPASSHTSKDQCAGTKENCLDGDKPLKVEPCDQGSCDRRIPVSDHISQGPNQSLCSKESPVHQNESSVMTTSNCSERFASDMLVNGKCKNETGSFTSKIEAGSSGCSEAGEFKLDGEVKMLVKDETNKSAKVLIGTGPDMCGLEDPVVWEGEPPALVSSDSSTKVPMYVDHIPQRSFPTSRDDVKVVSRDDDENSSGCTHPVTSIKYSRPAPSRIGDRRIRKILASKYWKVAPKLKDDIHSNSCKWLPCTKRMHRDQKPNYLNRKNCFKRQRSQMNIPFKKRKLFDRSAVLNIDEGISREGFFDLRGKGITGDASASCSKMQGAAMKSSLLAGQHSSFQSRSSHVKLRIKSFRVPELFIEIPDTATVGSLKKTVMDAVTAVLGGGLCVGVLLQGKKVRDDNKTLLQTGISQDNQLDSLGFTLEPNSSQTPPPLCSGDSPCILPCDVLQPLTRYPSGPTSEASPEPHTASLGNFIESDHDSAPSPTDMSAEKSTTDSKALVAVPDMSVEALAVVPGHRKSKRFDIGQRRIRRPFSVAEVEALVQAVEKLGTGRWRDVKLRAFDNAKHRTYVDLKDKWKTLVHTARISPQQRRGEPVPQELLDRVLTAHAYWSQQQAKQQLKQPETCLLV